MKEFEELLIEEVRKYENLWKITSRSFKSVEMATASWKKVSDTLVSLGIQVSENECRKKWKYLRDNFIRLRNKCQQIKSGEGASNEVKWKYYNNMTFLTTSEVSAPILSSLNSTSEMEDTQPMHEEEGLKENLIESTSSKKSISKRKRKELSEVDEEIMRCMRTLSDKHNSDQHKAFGDYVSQALKVMNPSNASKAKFEIQKVSLYQIRMYPSYYSLQNMHFTFSRS